MLTWLLVILVGLIVVAAVCFAAAMLAGIIVGSVQTVINIYRLVQGRPPIHLGRRRSAGPVANRVPVAAEVRAKVMACDGFACVYCGADHDLTVDHVVPRVLGGSNDPENLVCSCRPCNASKGTGDSPGARRRLVQRQQIINLWHAERILSRNGHH